jgi:hypothetical protein
MSFTLNYYNVRGDTGCLETVFGVVPEKLKHCVNVG